MTNSEANRRLIEVNTEIRKLQRKKKKLEGQLKFTFDDERDYLTKKIPNFYSHDDKGCKWINKQYLGLWNGIRTAACFQVFHVGKIPKEATDEDIQKVKIEMRKFIDQLATIDWSIELKEV